MDLEDRIQKVAAHAKRRCPLDEDIVNDIILLCRRVNIPLDGGPHREWLVARSVKWYLGEPWKYIPPFLSVTYLYTVFDANGVCIYIGITDAPNRRWQQHHTSSFSQFILFASHVEWFPCLDRRLATLLEKCMIRFERPVFNSVHTGEYSQRARKAYVAVSERFAGDVTHNMEALIDVDSPYLEWATEKWSAENE